MSNNMEMIREPSILEGSQNAVKNRKIRRIYQTTKIGTYFLVVVIYLLFGGLVFHLLEGPNETQIRTKAQTHMNDLNISVQKAINSTIPNIPRAQIENITKALYLIAMGAIEPSKTLSSNVKWTFGQSIYFSLISITTIGYGTLAPVTAAGQVALCIYALFGIPMFILLASSVSKRFVSMFEKYVIRKVKTERARWIAIILVLCIGFVVLLLFPAVIFAIIEGWTYNSALYFCFVSLSTIGFGDLTLGLNPNRPYSNDSQSVIEIYVLSALVWVFTGLIFLALLIDQVGVVLKNSEDFLIKYIDRFFARTGINLPDVPTNKELEDET